MEVENQKLQKDLQLQNQQMIQQEREAQLALKTEQQAHEEDMEKAGKGKEQLRMELTSEKQEVIHNFNLEKEEMQAKFEGERTELNEEMEAMIQVGKIISIGIVFVE